MSRVWGSRLITRLKRCRVCNLKTYLVPRHGSIAVTRRNRTNDKNRKFLRIASACEHRDYGEIILATGDGQVLFCPKASE
jgi:hypothetical protein